MKMFLATVLVAVIFFFLPAVGALMGAFSGWVVGLFFDETCALFLKLLGLSEVAMWEVGAFLGFVGGFFKSTQTNTSS